MAEQCAEALSGVIDGPLGRHGSNAYFDYVVLAREDIPPNVSAQLNALSELERRKLRTICGYTVSLYTDKDQEEQLNNAPVGPEAAPFRRKALVARRRVAAVHPPPETDEEAKNLIRSLLPNDIPGANQVLVTDTGGIYYVEDNEPLLLIDSETLMVMHPREWSAYMLMRTNFARFPSIGVLAKLTALGDEDALHWVPGCPAGMRMPGTLRISRYQDYTVAQLEAQLNVRLS